MKKHSGLTLIEVLIASIILFMVLGLVSVVMQQNINTQQQTLKYLYLMADSPSINANIAFELSRGVTSGVITKAGREYDWNASSLEVNKPIMDYSPETGQQLQAESVVILYEVEVVSPGAINYDFRRMVWQESEE